MSHTKEELMSEAQVFASAWALVGSRFDNGDGIMEAEMAKTKLSVMITEVTKERDRLAAEMQDRAERFARLNEELERLTSELEAIKSQKPVAYLDANYGFMRRGNAADHLPIGTNLYAGPVTIDQDTLADLVTGMEVSVDVSTCEDDIDHRYFGEVSDVVYSDSNKNGIVLLVQHPEPNFVTTDRDAWQPIETAPKDGLFFVWRKHCTYPIIARYNLDYDWIESFINGEHLYTLTHWMKLPEPPTTQEGK